MAQSTQHSDSSASRLSQLYASLELQAGQLPLTTTAADIVPGEGNPEAAVLFIGEAPGFNEQQQRRPFVGRSGQLLRATLTQLEMPPETVYIANIVKARPPENRDPFPAEILAYKPALDAEIEIINPQLIVTLGRFSMAKFLPEVKISQVHGKLHKVVFQGMVRFILPMYHPAAALRNPATKQAFIADMSKIPAILTWLHKHTDSYQLETAVKDSLL
jgi:DNA polymerase